MRGQDMEILPARLDDNRPLFYTSIVVQKSNVTYDQAELETFRQTGDSVLRM